MDIGIAQGYVTLGGIGFEGRLDYGATDTVCNLEGRLGAEAQGGEVLISQRVNSAPNNRLAAEPAGEPNLKDSHRPAPVFRLVDVKAACRHVLLNAANHVDRLSALVRAWAWGDHLSR
jgi:adenylate cyclase